MPHFILGGYHETNYLLKNACPVLDDAIESAGASQIRLHLFRQHCLPEEGCAIDPERREGEFFFSSVFRTSTELQDIQIALLQDILQLVER